MQGPIFELNLKKSEARKPPATNEIRTCDLQISNPMFYHLSHYQSALNDWDLLDGFVRSLELSRRKHQDDSLSFRFLDVDVVGVLLVVVAVVVIGGSGGPPSDR